MNKRSFHANGKLLITGEYLVMQGAIALAVPTKFGQKMDVSHGIPEYEKARRREGENTRIREGELEWKSYYKEECWFEGSFSLEDLNILESTDDVRAGFIQKLLREANSLNPEILKEQTSWLFETKLDFNPDWGLGSSSSLISMVAECFELDPYQLFKRVQQGSAYDIACARSDAPLWYRLVLGSPIVQPVVFNPGFRDMIAFVYSGKKQDSDSAVASFNENYKADPSAMDRISQIGRDLTSASDMKEFNELVDEHEHIMSKILELPRIKYQAFPDFPGSIKSLGAWGGDFMMASSEIGFLEIKSYFSSKGLKVIFSFDELIKSE